MASRYQARLQWCFFFLLFHVLALLLNVHVQAENHINNPTILMHPKHHKPAFKPGPWKNAHATFYGEPDGSGTTRKEKETNYNIILFSIISYIHVFIF